MTITNHFGCVKNTIRLRSGRYFDFIDPTPEQFELGDIAGALRLEESIDRLAIEGKCPPGANAHRYSRNRDIYAIAPY